MYIITIIPLFCFASIKFVQIAFYLIVIFAVPRTREFCNLPFSVPVPVPVSAQQSWLLCLSQGNIKDQSFYAYLKE